jgi:hypothetical protein
MYMYYEKMTGNRQKPSRIKALLSKNDKADKSPPVKMIGRTKAHCENDRVRYSTYIYIFAGERACVRLVKYRRRAFVDPVIFTGGLLSTLLF